MIISSCILFAATITLNAQKDGPKKNTKRELATYLIEREIPGAGQLTDEQLQGISKKSCTVLDEMGPSIQWLQSYVAEDKVFCIYMAESEELIRQHAEKGGFPVNKISLLANTISPETAQSQE